MGSIDPVSGDPKEIVRQGYDACGPRYLELRAREAPEVLFRVIERLPEGATVLDIGCGAGTPVATTLAGYATVTGVDISEAQVRAARAVLPDTSTVIAEDILAVELPADSFDAVVSFYTLFHVPREEHRLLFERIKRWLKPGGLLLITTARTAHEGYTEDDFCGVTMYWSHFGPEWYDTVLEHLGFNVLERGALPAGTGEGHDHPTFLAQLREPPAGLD